MKIVELLERILPLRTLSESDEFIAEMGNFIADYTELPANIVLWTEPNDPGAMPHSNYRMKVFKDRTYSATFSIGDQPELLLQTNHKKYRLTGTEMTEVKNVISRFSSLFVQYVDKKMTLNDVKFEMKKILGEK